MTGAGAQLFDCHPAFLRPILVVCGLPPGYYNFTSGCHGISKPANFSPPVYSPTGEASKNVPTGFFRIICGLPPAFYRDLRSATIVIGGENYKSSIYIVKGIFSKIFFSKDHQKMLKYCMVAVH
jgi:hypothetical protein